ncbi:hypothetical protein [Candidatus Fukatsuia symbiotica]|uniref:hypothetical protein n=1 Tax=Candidatus Fukatsuia symbiotica TaxID=1878942 RepID=UPI001F0746C6|nr:hypothetical protein [Candidatus Fukatsuia symbiotica]
MMKGVYTITLSCQGKKLTSLQRHIVALEVILTVNKIPTAQLVIAERGPPAEQPFHLSRGIFLNRVIAWISTYVMKMNPKMKN